MVLGSACSVNPLEDIEEAEFLDAGEDLGDAFTYQLFFFYLFGFFGCGIKIHEDKIFAVVSGFVYCYAAASVFEEGFELGLIFIELFFEVLMADGSMSFFVVRFHFLSPFITSEFLRIAKHLRGFRLTFSDEAIAYADPYFTIMPVEEANKKNYTIKIKLFYGLSGVGSGGQESGVNQGFWRKIVEICRIEKVCYRIGYILECVCYPGRGAVW